MYLTATKGFPGFAQPKKWSAAFQDFVRQCFHMNPIARADCVQLLNVCVGRTYRMQYDANCTITMTTCVHCARSVAVCVCVCSIHSWSKRVH
jgi:hypothetical protein